MAVYWPPGSPYLPPQADPGASRRGGVAAAPAGALVRPGYPPVTLPPSALRYVVPPSAYTGANGQVYVRQPQADSRNPRLSVRPPYSGYLNQDGIQMVAANSSILAHTGGYSGIVPPDPAHQIKRPRIDSRGTPIAPLSIDTRESVKEATGYQPQVEAISPTPEDRPAERDDIKSTKDDLLQKISKVDREIAKAESQIAKLKKKQEELEDAAKKPSTDSSVDEEKPNQSTAQNVYSENRRKASQSHASLNRFSPGNLLPLYNQPSDTEVYNKNKKDYTVFKRKLVDYFKKKNEENETRDRYMTVTYCKLTSVWTKKVDRAENSKKKKEREGKSREMYEKMFPELRKQREDKERNERLGTRGTVRSDQEFQDVIDRIQEHEMEEKKMHSYAVIPPPLLPPEDRRRKFTNNNGHIPDPMLIYSERKFVNMWTDAEKETFREKYLQHPKNFFVIAQYLERKSVPDCVQYYYLSKKTENYKQLLRKSRTKGGTRTRRPNNPTGEVIAPNVPGVVTRRTVQGLQEKDGDGKVNSRSNTPQPSSKQDKDVVEENLSEKDGGKGRKGGREKKLDESSDDEDTVQSVKCGPHPCVVCKTTVDSSRAVPKERAGQLGLKEEEVTENSRVCNNCWCKTLRSKCPLLSCSTAGKGKKLRHLPHKWKELPQATKDNLIAELQIPSGTKQVCTTCFGRINKRIGQLEEGERKADKEEVNWTEAEVDLLKQGLRQHGSHWDKVAALIPEKRGDQCKKYFYSMRKRENLDKIVQEYKKANRPQGSEKPSLSSDEESGSSTSSCEDENNQDKNQDKNRDLKAPETPTAPVTQTSATKSDEAGKKAEEGYDSAATISADETLEQDRGAGRTQGKVFPVTVTPSPAPQAGAGPMTKTIYVKDIMNTVIDQTLSKPSTQHRTGEVSTIKDLIQDPPMLQGHGIYGKPTLGLPSQEFDVRSQGGPSHGQIATSAPIHAEEVVLNLTTTKRDRSSPSPHPGPSEPVFRTSYVENHNRGAPGFVPTPASRGEKPPEAHGDKDKTTHKDCMAIGNLKLQEMYNGRSIHSPSHKLHRPDPRQDILRSASIPPPQSHAGRMEGSGSITRGQPIPQQHSTGRFDLNQMKSHQNPRGSLTSGTPVYTDRRTSAAYTPEQTRSHQQTMIDMHKKASAYSAYARPPSHDSRGSSSRSVIENDYKIAQTLPRKDQNDELRGVFPRSIDNRGRDVLVVDMKNEPRFDPRSYGSQRMVVPSNPYSGIRTDPKADMPSREPPRGDPRADLHDPRLDQRSAMDPRARQAFSTYPVSMPTGREIGRSSPPRTLPPNRGHTGPPSSVPSPRPGSITSGLPRSSVEIHTISRQPEVSITKQPAMPNSRPEYPTTNLANFAEIASQQAKMRENDHRGNPSLTVTRTEIGGPSSARMSQDLAKAGYDNRVGKFDERSRVGRDSFNVMPEPTRMDPKTSAAYKALDQNMTTKRLIDMIVTNQINKNPPVQFSNIPMSSAAASVASYSMPSRPPPQSFMDGKESPSKKTSRSPSVKTEGEDRSMPMRSSPAMTNSHPEHENMFKEEAQKHRTSPYPGPSTQAESLEYWKRKQYSDPNFMPRPPSQGSLPRPPSGGVAQLSDERQIIRVAQNASPRPDKPPGRSMLEAISPPGSDPSRSTPNYNYQGAEPMVRYFAAAQRKPHEVDPAAAKSSGVVFDYVKNKIAEVMKNDKGAEAGKSPTPSGVSMGPPNKRPLEIETRGSPASEVGMESLRKRYKPDEVTAGNDMPDSPGSGEMVIDETARPDSAHSHKTESPAPHADPNLYQGYRMGQQQLPPRSSPGQATRPPPAANSVPASDPRYEPLSDDD